MTVCIFRYNVIAQSGRFTVDPSCNMYIVTASSPATITLPISTADGSVTKIKMAREPAQ